MCVILKIHAHTLYIYIMVFLYRKVWSFYCTCYFEVCGSALFGIAELVVDVTATIDGPGGAPTKTLVLRIASPFYKV
jgi:hypothetical protein